MNDTATVARRTAAQRDAMYHRLLAALRETGPDAPNVCEGWLSRDMLTHVWVMKHDPIAMPGIAIPALADFTARRGEQARDRLGGYAAMIDVLEGESGARFPLVGDTLPMARTDLGEWYVHLRDVLVANDMPEDPMDVYTRRSLWLQLPTVAKLARADAVLVEPELGRRLEVGSGWSSGTTVVGDAGDLLCWLFDRPAEVSVGQVGGDVPDDLTEAGIGA